MVEYTVSCGGTTTQWSAGLTPDSFPEHASLHAHVRELQREVNALKDVLSKEGGWWLRFRLTRYLRTR